MRKLVLCAVALLALTGCSVSPTPEPAPVEEVELPQSDSAEQFASVIAKHSESWTTAIDGLYDCRITWVLDSDSIPGQTCYLKEKTAHATAQIALRDLAELTPPAELEGLLDETTGGLQAIADIDLPGLCDDPATGIPAETDECDEALTLTRVGWTVFKPTLAAWDPYL